jgi:hypothetical protein
MVARDGTFKVDLGFGPVLCVGCDVGHLAGEEVGNVVLIVNSNEFFGRLSKVLFKRCVVCCNACLIAKFGEVVSDERQSHSVLQLSNCLGNGITLPSCPIVFVSI